MRISSAALVWTVIGLSAAAPVQVGNTVDDSVGDLSRRQDPAGSTVSHISGAAGGALGSAVGGTVGAVVLPVVSGTVGGVVNGLGGSLRGLTKRTAVAEYVGETVDSHTDRVGQLAERQNLGGVLKPVNGLVNGLVPGLGLDKRNLGGEPLITVNGDGTADGLVNLNANVDADVTRRQVGGDLVNSVLQPVNGVVEGVLPNLENNAKRDNYAPVAYGAASNGPAGGSSSYGPPGPQPAAPQPAAPQPAASSPAPANIGGGNGGSANNSPPSYGAPASQPAAPQPAAPQPAAPQPNNPSSSTPASNPSPGDTSPAPNTSPQPSAPQTGSGGSCDGSSQDGSLLNLCALLNADVGQTEKRGSNDGTLKELTEPLDGVMDGLLPDLGKRNFDQKKNPLINLKALVTGVVQRRSLGQGSLLDANAPGDSDVSHARRSGLESTATGLLEPVNGLVGEILPRLRRRQGLNGAVSNVLSPVNAIDNSGASNRGANERDGSPFEDAFLPVEDVVDAILPQKRQDSGQNQNQNQNHNQAHGFDAIISDAVQPFDRVLDLFSPQHRQAKRQGLGLDNVVGNGVLKPVDGLVGDVLAKRQGLGLDNVVGNGLLKPVDGVVGAVLAKKNTDQRV